MFDLLKRKLVLVGALAAVGVIGLAMASTASAEDKTLTLLAVDGSGIGGDVSLTEDGDIVQIVVNATGLTNGESYFSGAYDSTSVVCRGGLIGTFAAAAPADGETATRSYSVPGPIEDIFSVSVRQGDQPPGAVVACAEDIETTMTPPSTGSGGLLGGEGENAGLGSPALAGVLSLLAAAGVSAVAFRRWALR